MVFDGMSGRARRRRAGASAGAPPAGPGRRARHMGADPRRRRRPIWTSRSTGCSPVSATVRTCRCTASIPGPDYADWLQAPTCRARPSRCGPISATTRCWSSSNGSSTAWPSSSARCEAGMSDGGVRVERDGAVATIWLDRPAKRNAMSYAMWAALADACRRLAASPVVRVVVVRGAGGHFCAGADVGDLLAERSPGSPTFMEVNLNAENALATMPKPTIAYVEGDCIGGGCAIAIDCDLRIAVDGARFGITPAKLGVVYPARVDRARRPAARAGGGQAAAVHRAVDRHRDGAAHRPRRRGPQRREAHPLCSASCAPSWSSGPCCRRLSSKEMLAAVAAGGSVPAGLEAALDEGRGGRRRPARRRRRVRRAPSAERSPGRRS